MNIGDDDGYDDVVKDHGTVGKIKFASLLVTHAEHEMYPADSPHRMLIGYACADCNESWDMDRKTAKQSCGQQFIDDMVFDICKFAVNRTPEGILNLLHNHPEAATKLKRLACLM